MSAGAIISAVEPAGKAERAGLVPGDEILRINGETVQDLIDLSFALAEEKIELEVKKYSGEIVRLQIRKKVDETLGFEFESAVFDRVRTCANKCLFCFVDQMPSGLRDTLYVKDDDYRLSFLYGNFVTLTNLTEADFQRIRRLHLSPLYVSVHTTNGPLRERLLGTPRAAKIMEQLRRFAEAGIEMHTQVVLCPDHNDGEQLTKTIRELAELRPEILSLAIVPVGLTRFRTSCQPLRTFSAAEAAKIVAEVGDWQQKFRAETENSFVYLSDEFYLKAGLPIPAEEIYDGYPQLENGIGLVRSFLSDWDATGGCGALALSPERSLGRTVIVSGTAFAPTLAELLRSWAPTVHVEAVVNRFFGSAVNVSGLLTGGDIAAHVRSLDAPPQRLIIPATTLRKGAAVFLDGMTLEELKRIVNVPVLVVDGGAALRQSLAMEG